MSSRDKRPTDHRIPVAPSPLFLTAHSLAPLPFCRPTSVARGRSRPGPRLSAWIAAVQVAGIQFRVQDDGLSKVPAGRVPPHLRVALASARLNDRSRSIYSRLGARVQVMRPGSSHLRAYQITHRKSPRWSAFSSSRFSWCGHQAYPYSVRKPQRRSRHVNPHDVPSPGHARLGTCPTPAI